MIETPKHVAYNMAPSTTLTPPGWLHVSIHPDSGQRFKLCGFASAAVWLPGDLKALKVHVKGGKVWGMTKDRALEVGLQIEQAMRQQNGQPVWVNPNAPATAAKPQEGPAPAPERPVPAPAPKRPGKPVAPQQASLL